MHRGVFEEETQSLVHLATFLWLLGSLGRLHLGGFKQRLDSHLPGMIWEFLPTAWDGLEEL